MSLINLTAHHRTTVGKNENRRTRAAGRIPAVVYGEHRPSANVTVDTVEFERILSRLHGRNPIFNLSIEGDDEQHVALLREMQQHPVTDEIRHLDLFLIPQGAKVTVQVPVILEGEPVCVKFGEAEVIQMVDHVDVSCEPREMPDTVRLDVSSLVLLDRRFVRDLVAPAGEIVSDGDLQILTVKAISLLAEPGAGQPAAEGAAEGTKSAE
jgi:large subunit ribosomal protein L25